MGIDTPNGIYKGSLISKGKTKEIYQVMGRSGLVIMKNNDNISAGDGARMEKGEGKADLSTTITANVFEYLNSIGIKTHFKEKRENDEILVEKCDMVPVECVFRFVATGSFIKREKSMNGENAIQDGTILDTPIIELYYKNDVVLEDRTIISDPMIQLGEDGYPLLDDIGGLTLLDPKTGEILKVIYVKQPGVDKKINIDDFLVESHNIKQISNKLLEQTRIVGEGVKDLYEKVGIDTFDGKVEFGFNEKEELILADVIDGDSCRLRIPYVVEGEDEKNYLVGDFIPGELTGIGGKDKSYFSKMALLPEGMNVKRVVLAEGLDKQGFREGESIEDTLVKYRKLAEVSSEALSKTNINFKDEVIKGIKEDFEGII